MMAKKAEDISRAQWDHPIEFILACLGYAVGFGNVWRFPYLCFRNGGGAFLIPYSICLFAAGLPIFYMELCLGQFSSLGPIGIFQRISPIFEGIGWGMVVVSFVTAVFYNMILAWVLYYLALSFRTDLLWSSCKHAWNTYLCHSNLDKEECIRTYGEGWGFFNKTCLNGSDLEEVNKVYNASNRHGPAEEFFEEYILGASDGFHEIGDVQWRLVVVLLAAWVIVFFCLIKGVKSTGKVVYFTATFPYAVLIILLVRGLTLEGAWNGVKFYITPEMDKLKDISVWKDAANQIFFSLSAAFGGLLTMASYNKFDNNCYRDALLITFMNCGTSIFAGFAVFSIAGFMAHDLGLPVKDVVRDGLGLAFIAYPEAISRLPLSPVWAVLFFFMLLTLGLDSQFAFVETATTGIQDTFPTLRRHGVMVVLATCSVGFVCGLPMCTRAGVYIFTLLNDYAAGYCVICLAVCELIATSWLYGVFNFINDIKLMLGVNKTCLPICFVIGPTGCYWKIAWALISPIFLACIVAASFFFYVKSSYGTYEFPLEAQLAGWAVSLLSIGCVPVFALYRALETCCGNKKTCGSLFRASPEWCPAHEREARRRNLTVPPEVKDMNGTSYTDHVKDPALVHKPSVPNQDANISEESVRWRERQTVPNRHKVHPNAPESLPPEYSTVRSRSSVGSHRGGILLYPRPIMISPQMTAAWHPQQMHPAPSPVYSYPRAFGFTPYGQMQPRAWSPFFPSQQYGNHSRNPGWFAPQQEHMGYNRRFQGYGWWP